MMGYVIRRPSRPRVEVVEAPPQSERREVPKARRPSLHAEVLGEFRRFGRIDNGDPLRNARGEACGGDS